MKKNIKWWPVLGLAVTSAAVLTACGGSSSSGDTSVRVLNATLSHPSIDLLVNASAAVSAVTTDTVSAYVSPSSGSVVLQVNDASQSTALTTLSPTISSGAHDTLVVYEGASGAIKTTLLPEDTALPASGSAGINVLDAAIDAGALDVYITAVGADLSTATPTFTLPAQNFVQFPGVSTLTPGTYQIRVTGQGNKTDLRANIPSVALASQQLGLLVLTPASGGILLNAGVLLEQVATTYTAQRNTNSRVRLVSGVYDPATVTVGATAGSATLAAATAPSPSINAYSTVPAGSALSATVNNAAVTLSAAKLAAGSDYTLFLSGTPGAVAAQLVTDDNHLPVAATSTTTVTSSKFRLLNGLAGSNASAATLSVNSNFLAAVAPGSVSSAYSTVSLGSIVSSNVATETDVNFASVVTPTYLKATTLSQNSVYTMFVLGNPAAPLIQLRLDR